MPRPLATNDLLWLVGFLVRTRTLAGRRTSWPLINWWLSSGLFLFTTQHDDSERIVPNYNSFLCHYWEVSMAQKRKGSRQIVMQSLLSVTRYHVSI